MLRLGIVLKFGVCALKMPFVKAIFCSLFFYYRLSILMNFTLSGSCVNVALDVYMNVPACTIPFVVLQYVVCKPTEKRLVVFFLLRT